MFRLGVVALLVLAAPPAARAAGADAARGQSIYMANCMACHGVQADGAGPAAAALKPKPTDFTSATWWTGKDDKRVMASIKTGKPGTAMMPFGQLTDDDLAHLLAFLKTKKPTETPK